MRLLMTSDFYLSLLKSCFQRLQCAGEGCGARSLELAPSPLLARLTSSLSRSMALSWASCWLFRCQNPTWISDL